MSVAGSEQGRATVRDFIATGARARGVGGGLTVDDHTPLVETGLLSSLMVADLLILLEELRGAPVDVTRLEPGVFRDVDTIARTFLEDGLE